jgi:hypothetical protein
MTNITWAALPLAVLLCIPTPALNAQPTSAPPIVVTASPRAVALAEWSTRVGRNIESKMRLPYKLGQTNGRDRLVEIAFVTDDRGVPANVRVTATSGSGRTDRAAVRAINRSGTFAPLPEGMNRNQGFRAQLAYLEPSGSDRDLKRRISALQDTARQRNAWYTSQDEVASGTVFLMAATR